MALSVLFHSVRSTLRTGYESFARLNLHSPVAPVIALADKHNMASASRQGVPVLLYIPAGPDDRT